MTARPLVPAQVVIIANYRRIKPVIEVFNDRCHQFYDPIGVGRCRASCNAPVVNHIRLLLMQLWKYL